MSIPLYVITLGHKWFNPKEAHSELDQILDFEAFRIWHPPVTYQCRALTV